MGLFRPAYEEGDVVKYNDGSHVYDMKIRKIKLKFALGGWFPRGVYSGTMVKLGQQTIIAGVTKERLSQLENKTEPSA